MRCNIKVKKKKKEVTHVYEMKTESPQYSANMRSSSHSSRQANPVWGGGGGGGGG